MISLQKHLNNTGTFTLYTIVSLAIQKFFQMHFPVQFDVIQQPIKSLVFSIANWVKPVENFPHYFLCSTIKPICPKYLYKKHNLIKTRR